MKNKLTICALSVLLLFVGVGAVQAEQRLLFFSDDNAFHGCLNCNRYDRDSICNKYGDFGSRYRDASIWNRYGSVGSKYREQSPWNRYGVGLKIVDEKGRYYGRFSRNKNARERVRNEALNSWFNLYERLDDLEAVRNMVCNN